MTKKQTTGTRSKETNNSSIGLLGSNL